MNPEGNKANRPETSSKMASWKALLPGGSVRETVLLVSKLLGLFMFELENTRFQQVLE